MKYLEQYQEYHRGERGPGAPNYPGNSYRRQHSRVAELLKQHGAQSMLDYGCGKGLQWTQKRLWTAWNFQPDLYDPAVEQYSQMPAGPWDAIISTDVFEHIPAEELPEIIRWMSINATRFIFLGIADCLAKAILPNGENAHCTVESHEWWRQTISDNRESDVPVYLSTYPTQPESSIIS